MSPGATKSGLLIAGLVLAAGCAQPDDGEEAVVEKAVVEEAVVEEAMVEEAVAQEMPEATAEAVWAFLEAADFRNTWELWPGKGEKYEGSEPHGALLTTYVNAPALQAVSDLAGEMPVGSVVVKDNFMPDGMLGATTVMYKVEGYNPEASDWWWAKFMPDGSVDMDGMAQGRVEMCIGCHAGGADNDYLMTAKIGP